MGRMLSSILFYTKMNSFHLIFCVVLSMRATSLVNSTSPCPMDEWQPNQAAVCDWLNTSTCALVNYRGCYPMSRYNCHCDDAVRPAINASSTIQLCSLSECPIQSRWSSWGVWSRYMNSRYACIRTRSCRTGGEYSHSWVGCFPVWQGRQTFVSNRKLRCQDNDESELSVSYSRYIIGSVILVVALFIIFGLCRIKVQGRNSISGVVHMFRSRRHTSRGTSNQNDSGVSQTEGSNSPPSYTVAISTSTSANITTALSGKTTAERGQPEPSPDCDDDCTSQGEACQLPSYDEVIKDGKINPAYLKE